jgi:hypothetical protein
MPREDRRIIFDLNETYKGLYTLSQKQDDAPQMIAGTIESISISSDDANNIEVLIVNPQVNEKAKIIYSRDFVAAALMVLCRSENIPLPRKAAKTVMIDSERVILRVMI